MAKRSTDIQTHSVLGRVSNAQVCVEPFPHVVADDCLPRHYFEALSAVFPTNETILRYSQTNTHRQFEFDEGRFQPNHRYDISSFQVREDAPDIAHLWLEFMRYHVSAAFYAEFATLLGDEIHRVHPSLEATLGHSISDLTTGVRFASDCDISLDCQVGINSPAIAQSSVREVHVDARVELFAILLYFRTDADDTPGGDLKLYRWKEPRKRRFLPHAMVDWTDVEPVQTIEYKANRMVMFLNTLDSLHAVTPRAPSPHPRRLVNIIGDVNESIPDGLFAMPKKRTKDYFRRKLASYRRTLSGRRR